MGADVTCPDLGHVTCCKRFVETGCGLYLDSKWLSRFMFSSWDSRRILFGAKGELIAESRATARRREENVFGVLDFMGGLAGERVRSRNSRGIPKKKSCSLNSGPGSRVIQRQGQFDSNGLVKKLCKWVRKMKISQNL